MCVVVVKSLIFYLLRIQMSRNKQWLHQNSCFFLLLSFLVETLPRTLNVSSDSIYLTGGL